MHMVTIMPGQGGQFQSMVPLTIDMRLVILFSFSLSSKTDVAKHIVKHIL